MIKKKRFIWNWATSLEKMWDCSIDSCNEFKILIVSPIVFFTILKFLCKNRKLGKCVSWTVLWWNAMLIKLLIYKLMNCTNISPLWKAMFKLLRSWHHGLGATTALALYRQYLWFPNTGPGPDLVHYNKLDSPKMNLYMNYMKTMATCW